jgi:hypothetical protein
MEALSLIQPVRVKRLFVAKYQLKLHVQELGINAPEAFPTAQVDHTEH